MSVKTIPHPIHGRNVKFGRKRPIARGLRMAFRHYSLSTVIPSHPTACDFRKPALNSLYRLFLNDQLGDCVIAAGYHTVGVETGNAGRLFVPSQAQIIKDYSAIGGYVPGNENTDNGCDEETALNYWCQHGFADGTKGLGWLTVDGTNKQEVQAAQYLFENLFFAMELPDAWVSPMPQGTYFKWDVAGDPVPDNGHAIMGLGYTSTGVIVDSWGIIGEVTWPAIAKYAVNSAGGGLYTMITPDQLAKGASKAPNGVNWATLTADFVKLGGRIK